MSHGLALCGGQISEQVHFRGFTFSRTWSIRPLWAWPRIRSAGVCRAPPAYLLGLAVELVDALLRLSLPGPSVNVMSIVLGLAVGSILKAPSVVFPCTVDVNRFPFKISLSSLNSSAGTDLPSRRSRRISRSPRTASARPEWSSSSVAPTVFDRFQTTSMSSEPAGAANSVGRSLSGLKPRQIVKSSPSIL